MQRQGCWTSPAVLLATYAHIIPTEITGYADALAAPDGPIRPLLPKTVSDKNGVSANSSGEPGSSVVGPRGIEPRADGLKVQPQKEIIQRRQGLADLTASRVTSQ